MVDKNVNLSSQDIDMTSNNVPDWMIKTLKIQVTILVVLGLGLAITNAVVGYSLALGGGIYVLPLLWSWWREFGARRQHQSPQGSLLGILNNEMVKIGMTIVLFTIAFKFIEPIHKLTILTTYIGCHVSAMLLPLVIAKHNSIMQK